MYQILNYILNIPTAFAQPFTTTGSNSTNSAATDSTNQIQDLFGTIIHSIPYWVTGFIVIILSLILSRIVKSTVENRMADAGIEEEHKEVQLVAGRASSAAVLLIGITAGLKIAGLDLTSIIAAAAFGVGFAMQDIIMNFVSGIIILLQKQFTIGDWIKVNGTMGIIKEVQSRYTIIKKFDGTNVIVPNSELFKNQVNSLTTNPERRFTIDIAVDFYMDLKEVIDQLYESIDKCDKILKHPKASIIVQAPGPYYNSIKIRAWVVSKKGILKPISALVRQIHKDFYRKGWSFPYQVNHLYFDKDAQPDITQKSKNYIDAHKKALKSSGIVQQQQQVLQQQQAQNQQVQQSQPVGMQNQQPVANVGTPAQPIPQAQQVGIGGPEMQAPVWLQQATNQMPQSQQSPQIPEQQNQQPTPDYSQQANQPVAQNPVPADQNQPQAYIQHIEIGPEVKTAGASQPQEPAISMPIVSATDVTKPQTETPTVAMPLADVEPQIPVGAGQVDPNQQS